MKEGRLAGKVALVTGGTRGIGRAILLALCKESAECVFTYTKNCELAESVVKELQGLERHALSVQLDVRDFEGAKLFVERAKSEFGKIDILVNNAGITRDKSLIMMTKDDWSEVIDTDLTGVFNTTRACIITFLKQKSGNIVNISSMSGVHPLPGQVNYAAAKAGVIGFTKSLAKEVAAYNIRVNAVAPGFISSDMTASLNENYRRRLNEMIPAGRFGTPDEVAEAVLFLLSDESRYITGEVIQIDGGLGLLG
ncbi:MAG TPA: 3-oxoacyl-[acyl-carrier-protein] reductase [Thermodesulfovibrionales bacterium]|nr:3-oxoacyl-[acyl-carrier-protein] reductase [Thermodesulfovibrionales bacterium]